MLATSLGTAAFAQGTPLPEERTQGPVTYVSGGVGIEQAQAMRRAEADYPLTLELAAAAGGPRDEYVSGAEVTIRDHRGSTVLQTRTAGPLVLVRLPPDRYDVDVDWNGAHRHRSIDVGQRRQHVLVEFSGSLDSR